MTESNQTKTTNEPETVQTGQPPAEDFGEQKAPPNRKPYIEMAKDELGEWNWCLWSSNGKAICVGAQPWKRRNDCQNNVETAIALMKAPNLKIVAGID